MPACLHIHTHGNTQTHVPMTTHLDETSGAAERRCGLEKTINEMNEAKK